MAYKGRLRPKGVSFSGFKALDLGVEPPRIKLCRVESPLPTGGDITKCSGSQGEK